MCVLCVCAVMSSHDKERPQDAKQRGQRITRTDVLTAQFPWEQTPPTLPTTITTTNITPPPPPPPPPPSSSPPPILPHCSCKSLTRSPNMLCRVFMPMPWWRGPDISCSSIHHPLNACVKHLSLYVCVYVRACVCLYMLYILV